jgi:hypothetical protein
MSGIYGQMKLASGLANSNLQSQHQQFYCETADPVDKRPLVDRLADARTKEKITKAERENKVQESADRIMKINEAMQLCLDYPHITRLFDVLKSIGLS